MIRTRFDDVKDRPLLGLRKGPNGKFRDPEELDDYELLREAFRLQREESRRVTAVVVVAMAAIIAVILIQL